MESILFLHNYSVPLTCCGHWDFLSLKCPLKCAGSEVFTYLGKWLVSWSQTGGDYQVNCKELLKPKQILQSPDIVIQRAVFNFLHYVVEN